jgi:hypothetical protein
MAGVSIETRFMSARSFFDTNVLMHADDKEAPPSDTGPSSWLPASACRTDVVSLQVLHEYFVTVTRKLGVDARIVRRKVELLAEFDVAASDVTEILAALIFIGRTGVLSGTRWFCGRPNSLAVASFCQRISGNREGSMGFTSWIRSYACRRLTSNISLSG